MTERFIPDGGMVRDIEGKIPTILTHDKEQLNEFLTGLNELYEEKEFWKQKSKEYLHRLTRQVEYGSYDDTRYVKIKNNKTRD